MPRFPKLTESKDTEPDDPMNFSDNVPSGPYKNTSVSSIGVPFGSVTETSIRPGPTLKKVKLILCSSPSFMVMPWMYAVDGPPTTSSGLM